MFNFLLSLCIFCISLSPQIGVLELRDSNGMQNVNHNFTYETSQHVYEVTTYKYWLNSVSACDVFFFGNCVIWHYIERPGTHPGEWTLKIHHEESNTWVIVPKKPEDYILVTLQDGMNTYNFEAVNGDEESGAFFKITIPKIFTVNRSKQ
jgi:hypothetical protein